MCSHCTIRSSSCSLRAPVVVYERPVGPCRPSGLLTIKISLKSPRQELAAMLTRQKPAVSCSLSLFCRSYRRRRRHRLNQPGVHISCPSSWYQIFLFAKKKTLTLGKTKTKISERLSDSCSDRTEIRPGHESTAQLKNRLKWYREKEVSSCRLLKQERTVLMGGSLQQPQLMLVWR